MITNSTKTLMIMIIMGEEILKMIRVAKMAKMERTLH
jgi:hypothetical protein